MAEVPLAERLARLAKAQDEMKGLLDDPARFSNECEEVFSSFRRACVHLRREQDALDTVEGKEIATRYMAKFCKERPPYHGRCEEVLKILIASDAWVEKFLDDPEVDVEHLPEPIKEDLKNRRPEKDKAPMPKADAPAVVPPKVDPSDVSSGLGEPPGKGGRGSMVTVVQRCSSARVLVDAAADRWHTIGRGLLVCVSFLQGATAECVSLAARSLLTASLSAGEPGKHGTRAESMLALCKRGEAQGLLVVPQASLVAQLGAGEADVTYKNLCPEDDTRRLYEAFVEALRASSSELVASSSGTCLPDITAAPFGEAQSWDVKSDGFMHCFEF